MTVRRKMRSLLTRVTYGTMMPLIGTLLEIVDIERKLRLPHATMGKKNGIFDPSV